MFRRTTATKGHCSSDAVGVGGSQVDGPITTETHTEHVDAVGVGIIVFERVVNDLHDFVGIPCPSRILRCDDVGVNVASAFNGIDCAISTYFIEVVSTQALAVEENDNGFRPGF